MITEIGATISIFLGLICIIGSFYFSIRLGLGYYEGSNIDKDNAKFAGVFCFILSGVFILVGLYFAGVITS